MPIGVTEDHEALRESVRAVMTRRCPPSVPRGLLDAADEPLPDFWRDAAELGWLGIAVSEDHAGAGAGLPELAVVVEELGRAVAPGPAVPTMLASLLLAESSTTTELAKRVATGELPATVGVGVAPLSSQGAGDGLTVTGTARPVLAGGTAGLFLLPIDVGGTVRWCALDSADVTVEPIPSLDLTRRVVTVTATGAPVAADRILDLADEHVRDLSGLVFAAEACGIAGWCLETASEYAKTRIQFGRPIGQFQAVKHRCADLLVAVEQARALTWDAAQAGVDGDSGRLVLTAAVAVALDLVVRAAKDCVQLLGGIGFTWEHDAHMYLRRALVLRQLLGPVSQWRARVTSYAAQGTRRSASVALPAEADDIRREVREFIGTLDGLDETATRAALIDSGYLTPHWSPPYGRGAGAVEQLVIEEEFRRAKVRRPGLNIGAWVVPTVLTYGTDEQRARWVRPTLMGELVWCQLFSEPGAGSDLASLSTRAERTDGGWLVSGQKVWTSLARQATNAILLARTGPPTAKDRRAGITYFVVDMTTPGIDVRPLRELTGEAMFNEVFLDNVFVPDDGVVGEVGDGWRLARTTLANERVSMASGTSFGAGIESVLKTAGPAAVAGDPVLADRIGAMVADALSVNLLGVRSTLRSLSGGDPGPEASVRKLLAAEHEQRVQELGLELLAAEGATTEGAAQGWTYGFLVTRCMTIAGGTSEVQRNVIGERLLGLPRDPEPPQPPGPSRPD